MKTKYPKDMYERSNIIRFHMPIKVNTVKTNIQSILSSMKVCLRKAIDIKRNAS